MDASSAPLGDVRTWFFLILSILLTLVGYVMKGDRERLDKIEGRVGKMAQRLSVVDGKTEET